MKITIFNTLIFKDLFFKKINIFYKKMFFYSLVSLREAMPRMGPNKIRGEIIMKMPKLTPIGIKTKGKSFFAKIWVWITEVRKWEVTEDWEYELPNKQVIIIPKAFVFDGASIPRPLWGLLSPTGLLLIQGLIHDFGYRYDYLWALRGDGRAERIYLKSGQQYWDKLFNEVGLNVNEMKIINSLSWLALATMGKFAWKKNRERNEEEVFPNRDIVENQDAA